MPPGQDLPIDDWSQRDEDFALIVDRAFGRKVFREYQSLRSLRADAAGYFVSKPYHGEPFDEAVWSLIPGGWDHEHCSLCFNRIVDGMIYWANRGEVNILCDDCRDHYAGDLTASPPDTLN